MNATWIKIQTKLQAKFCPQYAESGASDSCFYFQKSGHVQPSFFLPRVQLKVNPTAKVLLVWHQSKRLILSVPFSQIQLFYFVFCNTFRYDLKASWNVSRQDFITLLLQNWHSRIDCESSHIHLGQHENAPKRLAMLFKSILIICT